MTVASGVLVKVVLMIFLGCIEVLQRQLLYGQRLMIALLISKAFISIGQVDDATTSASDGYPLSHWCMLPEDHMIFFAAFITCIISVMSVGLASLIILLII